MRSNLKINLFVFALIAASMALAGCASLFLRGKVANNSYIAPAENFSCPIPDLGRDVKVQDSVDADKAGYVLGGTVRFVSWVGVYRIDYVVAHDVPVQEELDRMLNKQLDLYRQIPSPQAYVLHQETNDDRLFAVLVAPEGDLSAVNGFGKHTDLSRAMLIFKHRYYIYAVSADDRDLFAKSGDKSPERINRLRKQIEEFAGSMKFSTSTTTNQ